MFTAQAPVRAKKNTSKMVPFPIASKGLNTRHPLSAMPPGYAFVLINAIPEAYGLKTRKGYTEHVTELPGDGPVASIFAYYPSDVPLAFSAHNQGPRGNRRIGTRTLRGPVALSPPDFGGKIFAAREDNFYDVTLQGTDGSTRPAETGVTGDGPYWNGQMFFNPAGAFLTICNEEGGYAYYDGSAWAMPTMGGGAGQIANVDPADLCFVTEFKKRLWFIEKGTTKAWYLPTSSITGAATSFDFGEYFGHGGYLAGIANWTVDAGEGIDDYMVAVSSQGDVVIYQGTDPASAATWSQKGVWHVGPLPTGYRAVSRRLGDVHILTQRGLISVARLLSMKDQIEQASISHLIDPLVGDLMQSYSGEQGWQIVDASKEEMILVGMPSSAEPYDTAYLAYKTTTQAWTLLIDTNYASFASVDAIIYAGTVDGRVVLAFNGPLDDVQIGETTGMPIECEVVPAYQDIGERGLQKRALLFRPTFLATQSPELAFRILFDYSAPLLLSSAGLPALPLSLWDTELWDVGLWGGLQYPIRPWLSATGAGMSATPQMSYACGGETILTAIDLTIEQGGTL